jgi:hypothetical protein
MEKSTNHEAKLAEVYEKLESGDCTVSEAIREASALNTQIAVSQARNAVEQRTQEIFNNMHVEAANSKFHVDYPDYTEIVESGKLQPYIDRNPLLVDETLAYFQYKADQKLKGEEKDKLKTAEQHKKYLSRDALEEYQMNTISKIRSNRPARREVLPENQIEDYQLETIKRMRGE